MLVNTDWIITLPTDPKKVPTVAKTAEAPVKERLTAKEWKRLAADLTTFTIFMVIMVILGALAPWPWIAIPVFTAVYVRVWTWVVWPDYRGIMDRWRRGETRQGQIDRIMAELKGKTPTSQEPPEAETIRFAGRDPLLIALITSAAKEHPDYLTAEEHRVKHEQGCISGDCDHYPYSVWGFAPEAIDELLDRNHHIVDDYLQDIGLREYLEIMSRLGGSKDDLKRKSALQAIIDNAAEATWNSIKLDQVAQLETARERADRAIAANELLFLPAA